MLVGILQVADEGLRGWNVRSCCEDFCWRFLLKIFLLRVCLRLFRLTNLRMTEDYWVWLGMRKVRATEIKKVRTRCEKSEGDCRKVRATKWEKWGWPGVRKGRETGCEKRGQLSEKSEGNREWEKWGWPVWEKWGRLGVRKVSTMYRVWQSEPVLFSKCVSEHQTVQRQCPIHYRMNRTQNMMIYVCTQLCLACDS